MILEGLVVFIERVAATGSNSLLAALEGCFGKLTAEEFENSGQGVVSKG